MTKEIIGYMCKTDFELELGNAAYGTRVYSDIQDLKECRKCIEECGIVEVSVSLKRVISKGRYGHEN